MGLASTFDARTVTVIVNVGRQTVGLVVDAVSDVVETEGLQPPPAGCAFDTRCIQGLAAIEKESGEERMLIVLNADELLCGMAREERTPAH